MLVLGLTGGIACGKSTISQTLGELGAVIVDGDVLSRELTAPGGGALGDIRAAFGEGVFHPDGTLNRRALGSVVFADDKARDTLDHIMQPLLLTLILRDIEARDYQDSHRDYAPLKQAEDAVFIDTTHMTIDEAVDAVLQALEAKQS